MKYDVYRVMEYQYQYALASLFLHLLLWNKLIALHKAIEFGRYWIKIIVGILLKNHDSLFPEQMTVENKKDATGTH